MKLPEGVKMTPMLKQYGEWKEKYPDCMLLYRMGDFFEFFLRRRYGVGASGYNADGP